MSDVKLRKSRCSLRNDRLLNKGGSKGGNK